MTDVSQPTVDPAGIPRTETGEIKPPTAQPTAPTTGTDSKTPTTKTETSSTAPTTEPEGKTLLTEPSKEVPEKYEFTPPEAWKDKGWELDPKTIEAATPLFKELGLSQANAQKLVNFYAEQSQKDHEANINLVRDQTKEWENAVKADPEIGGRIPHVKTVVGRALDSLGTDLANSFRKAMDETGVGNHPAFVKAMFKLAEKLTEGSHVAGNQPSALGQKAPGTKPASIANALYPTLP